MSEKEKVKDIMHKFKQAREKRQYRDAKWEELDKFDRGEQWDSESIPPWVPKPVTNMVHLVKTTKRAAFAIENPTGEMRAVSSEEKAIVEKMNKVQKYVWKRIGSRRIMREVLETGKLLGDGIVQFRWDEEDVGGSGENLYEGEIRVRSLDPSSFFPDPTAHRIDDCQFIHIVERRPLDWVKKHPRFKKKAKELEASFKQGAEMGEIYTRNETATGREGIVDFHSHYSREPQSDGTIQTKVTYLANGVFLDEHNLEPNIMPFVKFGDYPQRQEFWSKSTCEYIIDNQKLLNKVEQIIAVIGTMLQNPQVILRSSSGINPRELKKYGLAPGHVWITQENPNEAMIWRQPPQIPQSLFNLMEQAKQNIREITGITQSYTGESVGSMQTSSGVQQMIERATMRDRDQMYDLEMFIEDYVRMMMRFVMENYDTERQARILRPDGLTDEYINFVGREFQDVEYDFEIDISAEAPMSKQRQIEEAEKLLNIQGQYQFDPPLITPEEFVKKSNFQDKSYTLARMEYEKVNNKIEMLMQVVEMLGTAEQQGISNEESMAMAQQMITQYEDGKNGIGSAAEAQEHSGQMQQQQQGMPM